MVEIIENYGAEADRHAVRNRVATGGENVARTPAPPMSEWKRAVRDAGREMLPRLCSLSLPDLKALMLQADVYLESQPLYLTGDRRFHVPLWGGDMTGAELVALVVLGLWLYYGESEHMVGGSIMGDWGEVIKAVV